MDGSELGGTQVYSHPALHKPDCSFFPLPLPSPSSTPFPPSPQQPPSSPPGGSFFVRFLDAARMSRTLRDNALDGPRLHRLARTARTAHSHSAPLCCARSPPRRMATAPEDLAALAGAAEARVGRALVRELAAVAHEADADEGIARPRSASPRLGAAMRSRPAMKVGGAAVRKDEYVLSFLPFVALSTPHYEGSTARCPRRRNHLVARRCVGDYDSAACQNRPCSTSRRQESVQHASSCVPFLFLWCLHRTPTCISLHLRAGPDGAIVSGFGVYAAVHRRHGDYLPGGAQAIAPGAPRPRATLAAGALSAALQRGAVPVTVDGAVLPAPGTVRPAAPPPAPATGSTQAATAGCSLFGGLSHVASALSVREEALEMLSLRSTASRGSMNPAVPRTPSDERAHTVETLPLASARDRLASRDASSSLVLSPCSTAVSRRPACAPAAPAASRWGAVGLLARDTSGHSLATSLGLAARASASTASPTGERRVVASGGLAAGAPALPSDDTGSTATARAASPFPQDISDETGVSAPADDIISVCAH